MLSDLKGKVTLINVWATWCAPCRVELPYVQRLHKALKNVPGLQVLTLNLDEDPSLVPGYMQAGGYTFPVIRSFALAEKIHPISEVPPKLARRSQGAAVGTELERTRGGLAETGPGCNGKGSGGAVASTGFCPSCCVRKLSFLSKGLDIPELVALGRLAKVNEFSKRNPL